MSSELPDGKGLAVTLSSVERTFPGGIRALDDVSLNISAGEYVAITGRSGSGKSTLLNVLGLLDQPNSGACHFEGIDVTAIDERTRARLRAQAVGFVFQAFHLLNYRSVLENVILGQLYLGVGPTERRTRATELLRLVGLEGRSRESPGVLSGGERQRVAIARALAAGPRLLLCDEPTGNLDSRTADGVLDLIDQLHADGLTVVMVTHDPDVSDRASRTIELSDGRVVRSHLGSRCG